MAKISSKELLIKSRILLEKFLSGQNPIFTKEDYFIFSISNFIALKESIIRKDSRTNTFYFDYESKKKEYSKIKYLVDKLLESDSEIWITINGQKIDMKKSYIFDSVQEVQLPLNQKIIIENFSGSKDELNEMIRVLWIFNKIRDSLVHAHNIEFDIENSKINVSNSIIDESHGSFLFEASINPDLLNFMANNEHENYAHPIYKYMNYDYNLDKDYNSKYKYYNKNNNLKEKVKLKPIKSGIDNNFIKFEEISERIVNNFRKNQIEKDVAYIRDYESLIALKQILLEYRRLLPNISNEQKRRFESRLIYLINLLSKEEKIVDSKTKFLIEELNETIGTNDNSISMLYSHMILLFSSDIPIDYECVKTTGIYFENQGFKSRIRNIVKKFNKNMDDYIKCGKYTEEEIKNIYNSIIGNTILEIKRVLKDRNRFLLNGIRNGVMHKNCYADSQGIVIFDRSNNNEDKKRFECSTNPKSLSSFLKGIDSNLFNEENYGIEDLFEEMRNILGESSNLDKFIDNYHYYYSFEPQDGTQLN